MRNSFIRNVGTTFFIGYIFFWIGGLEYARKIEKRHISDMLLLNQTVNEKGEILSHHYPILKAYINTDENYSSVHNQTYNTLELHTFPDVNKQFSCQDNEVSPC